MQPDGVVTVDPGSDGGEGLGKVRESVPSDQLALQAPEERLGHGVVVAGCDPAHRLAKPEVLTERPDLPRQELRPAVAVEDRTSQAAAPAEDLVDRLDQ